MLPLHPFHAQSPFRQRTSISRSGSCPTLSKSKPRAPAQETQSPLIVAKGSNVWAIHASDARHRRPDVWTLQMGQAPTKAGLVQENEAASPLRSWKTPVSACAFPPEWQRELARPCRSDSDLRREACKSVCEPARANPNQPTDRNWLWQRPGPEQALQAAIEVDNSHTASSPASGSPNSTSRKQRAIAPVQASRSPASSPLSGTNDALSIRVAIVGAGPVGLWVAVLLARAHARLFSTSSGFRITRLPGAPEINVPWPLCCVLMF